MFSTCLCWFLRLLAHAILVYLLSSSSILLGSPPDTYHVILVSQCLSVVFHACAGLSIDFCLSLVCLSFMHVPPLPQSGHFLGCVIRIFCVWCFLVNQSNTSEPCGRHTCCPLCEAPINHAVPCCSHQYICLGVGSLVSSSVAQGQLSGILLFFSPGLLSPSLFREGLSFKFLLFPILAPCWLP